MGKHVLTNFSLLGVYTGVLVSMNLCAHACGDQKSLCGIPWVPSCWFYINSCIGVELED